MTSSQHLSQKKKSKLLSLVAMLKGPLGQMAFISFFIRNSGR
jgi:hypothetical protein